MSKQPRIALKVNGLASSLTFYVDRLGFQLAESQPGADRAVVLDPYGDPILLAGPAVEDVSAHLDEPRIVYKPGATLDFAQEDLDARLATLTARGLTAIQQEQTDEGDRKLTIKDPSNYTSIFVQQRSPEKTRTLYTRGADDVEAALAGLTEADLDLTRAPDKWSIRQIVQLFQHIPDHWDRYVLLKFAGEEGEGDKVTVGALLDGLNWHLAEHCAEIREIRRVHHR